jgi:hypothetical protein
MTHREKVEHFIRDMQGRGVGPSTSAPPLFRLLWGLGLEVAPPLFWGFWPAFLVTGLPFAVGWGSGMWCCLGFPSGNMLALHAVVSLFTGLAFGACMAAFVRWTARRYNLPPWDRYPAAPGSETGGRGDAGADARGSS